MNIIQVYCRSILAVVCILGMWRWTMAELAYARGQGAPLATDSLRELGAAGEWWPYSYKFRTAQTKQFATMARRIPGMAEALELSLNYSLAIDRNSIELWGEMFLVKRALHKCTEAKAAANRLLILAPRVEKVQKLVVLSCEES